MPFFKRFGWLNIVMPIEKERWGSIIALPLSKNKRRPRRKAFGFRQQQLGFSPNARAKILSMISKDEEEKDDFSEFEQ